MAKNKRFIRKGAGGGKTEKFKFRGQCSYAMVYAPDDYLGVKKWKINLHPSEETIQEVKDAGIQLKLKDSNEEWSGVPGEFFTFNRPCEKEFDDGVSYFSPPAIYGPDGEPFAVYTEVDGGWEQDGPAPLIGNGSEVEIGVSVYKTKRFGKGQRLDWIKVLDLIEYNPDEKEDVSENEVDAEETDDMDDEIPFDGPTKKVKSETKAAKPAKKSSKVDW